MKITVERVVILALLLLLIGAILTRPKPDNQKIKDLESKVASREQLITQLQQDNAKHREKRKADSLQFTITVQAHKTEAKKWTSEIARIKAKPEVITVIQEFPQVDSLIRAYDTLVVHQIAQIQLQTRHIEDLRTDLSVLEANFQKRLDLQSENLADLQAVTAEQRKELRKLRRANRWTKVGMIAGTVLGILGGSRL